MVPAEYRIALADVEVIEGRDGLIGRGALGEVRRGRYAGTEVALKGLHMLRTDDEAAHAMGGALAPAERRAPPMPPGSIVRVGSSWSPRWRL